MNIRGLSHLVNGNVFLPLVPTYALRDTPKSMLFLFAHVDVCAGFWLTLQISLNDEPPTKFPGMSLQRSALCTLNLLQNTGTLLCLSHAICTLSVCVCVCVFGWMKSTLIPANTIHSFAWLLFSVNLTWLSTADLLCPDKYFCRFCIMI